MVSETDITGSPVSCGEGGTSALACISARKCTYSSPFNDLTDEDQRDSIEDAEAERLMIDQHQQYERDTI